VGKLGLTNNRPNNRKQERYPFPLVSHVTPQYGGETYEIVGMTKHGQVAETEKKLASGNRRFLPFSKAGSVPTFPGGIKAWSF
jgi:hypothetical protein